MAAVTLVVWVELDQDGGELFVKAQGMEIVPQPSRDCTHLSLSLTHYQGIWNQNGPYFDKNILSQLLLEA